MDIVTHQRCQGQARTQAGFTLIELMVVVSMVAILSMLAVPSWTQLQTRSAVRAAVNDFNVSLQLARSEAVRRNVPVTVCPSSDGVNCTNTLMHLGWIVRTGPAANAVGQAILQDVLPRNLIRMGATNAANRRFTFLPNGAPASNFAGAAVGICAETPGLENMTRTLVINRAGRVNLTSPGACPPLS